MSNKTAGEANPKKWDDFHNDPTLGIAITLADGISFRASSYRLSQISSAFAGLFSMPLQPTPIDLPSSAVAIRHLLDIAIAPGKRPERFPGKTTAEILDYLELVAFLECKALVASARSNLELAIARAPLEYLRLASRMGKITMVWQALQVGYASGKQLCAADLLATIADIRPDWRIAILHATLRPHCMGGELLRAQWPSAADLNPMMEMLRFGSCQSGLSSWKGQTKGIKCPGQA